MNGKCWRNLGLIVVALALAATVFAPTGTAGDRRLVVTVKEPFEIDGEIYPAGTLSVQGVRSYNPSSVLGEIWVGNQCLGMFQAARIASETEVTGESLTFRRTAEGRLALVGFASALQDHPGSYRFQLEASQAGSDTTMARR